MVTGLIGKKIGMTRIFSDEGLATAVSVVQIEPNRVVQTKILETDGYSALQVTTGTKVNKKGEAKIRNVPAAIKGHYAKAGEEIGLGLWEFKCDQDVDTQSLDISIFGIGHYVDVVGQSKGKGFQGGVKRHNFSMQDATHGNSLSHRALGSTGQCQEPGRVFKGKKMAGHMGDERITQECLEVLKVDNKRNLLLIKGAIPGAKNSFVKVLFSRKKASINTKITKQVAENRASSEENSVEGESAKKNNKNNKSN